MMSERRDTVYQWISGSSFACQVTFYATNITLNSAACSHFENIRWVRIGMDPQHKKVAIEPLKKQQIDLGIIPKDQLQKLSLGKGYGRISSKSVMHAIYTQLHVPVDTVKYPAVFNEEQNLLEIDCAQPQ
ncbi:hypothetical protein [uncultured Dubosiella sp.]|uniref:hypothetical protein n=2 Tax=uncultured Dubosiella sp. TaxID=1937011 RepID=UPI0025DA9197|nr:hypothetical protein [uncultured Dubosiella sp.]